MEGPGPLRLTFFPTPPSHSLSRFDKVRKWREIEAALFISLFFGTKNVLKIAHHFSPSPLLFLLNF